MHPHQAARSATAVIAKACHLSHCGIGDSARWWAALSVCHRAGQMSGTEKAGRHMLLTVLLSPLFEVPGRWRAICAPDTMRSAFDLQVNY